MYFLESLICLEFKISIMGGVGWVGGLGVIIVCNLNLSWDKLMLGWVLTSFIKLCPGVL